MDFANNTVVVVAMEPVRKFHARVVIRLSDSVAVLVSVSSWFVACSVVVLESDSVVVLATAPVSRFTTFVVVTLSWAVVSSVSSSVWSVSSSLTVLESDSVTVAV